MEVNASIVKKSKSTDASDKINEHNSSGTWTDTTSGKNRIIAQKWKKKKRFK